ncbi:MAG: sigma-70 family RNA polymerase sigma factor [Crocinitomicaceae bacterium]|nr:sigma-70 family RNA polymerase sigma factor [Crocinitomicaceae bacterium]
MTKKKQFMELYNPVHGSFERFCKARSYGVCDFNDLMHDTLVIAFEQFDSLKNKQVFLSFLFGIANKVHANFRRKNKPLSFSELKGIENTQDHSFSVDKNFQHDELYEALNMLPLNYRTCIILFEIAGFSLKETAEIQDCTVDAVKQRLMRGRKMLLVALSEKTTKTIVV